MRPSLRRARSLAGAPHAGSYALLQTLHLLKTRTAPTPAGAVRQSPSPLHGPAVEAGRRLTNRGPKDCDGRGSATGPRRGHKNRPRCPPAGRCLVREPLIPSGACPAAARYGVPSRVAPPGGTLYCTPSAPVGARAAARAGGGAGGSRTPDLRRAKAALSQLSYGPGAARSPAGGRAWNRTRDLGLIRTAL